MRFLLALAFSVVACSPSVSSETPTDGGTSGDTALSFDYCKEVEARTVRCEAGVYSATECSRQLVCYSTIVRPEDRNGLMECFAKRACGVKDDSCVLTASTKYTSDATVTAFMSACTDKRTACSASFPDDYCGVDWGLFTDEYRAKVKACLDKPCAEVGACVSAVYTAAGCK